MAFALHLQGTLPPALVGSENEWRQDLQLKGAVSFAYRQGYKTGSPGKKEKKLTPFLVVQGAWRKRLFPYPGNWMEKNKTGSSEFSNVVNVHSGTEKEVQRQSSAQNLLEKRPWST